MSETVRYSLGESRATMSTAKCDRDASVGAGEPALASKRLERSDLLHNLQSRLQWYWEILNMEFLPANCHPGILSVATPTEAVCERVIFFGILVLLFWAVYALFRSILSYSHNLLLLSSA